MSIHSVTRNLLRSGLAAGALISALGLAHAQTVLPELLVVSPSLVPIEASKTGSSVTAMSGEEARASHFIFLYDPGAAPATVSGEPSSSMPLGFPGKAERGQRPASQETCLRQSPFRCTGRALGAASAAVTC